MTQAAIEALGEQVTYEIWKRELGSGNIRPHGSGRIQHTDLKWALEVASRLNEQEPERNKRAWYLWESGIANGVNKPILWFYFVLETTTTRRWAK